MLLSFVVNGECLTCDRDLVSRYLRLTLGQATRMIPRTGADSDKRLVSCALLCHY